MQYRPWALFCSRAQPRASLSAGAALSLLTCLGACLGDSEGKPPGNLGWNVSFVCDADRTASDQLRLSMHKDDCSGPILYDELVSHGEEAPGALPLEPGVYGFRATALRQGMPLAQGCVLAALPPRASLNLELASDSCTQSDTSPDASQTQLDEVPESLGSSDASAPSQPRDPAADASMPPSVPGTAVVIDCGNEGIALSSCGVCGRVCATGQSCENGACRPTLTRGATCTAQRFRDHDYLFCEDKRSWSSARKLCREFGFGLASIEDQAENDFIARFAGKLDRWIGANDIGTNDIGVNDVDIGVDDFGLGNVASSCGKVAGPVGEGNWYWASKSADISNAAELCVRADTSSSVCTPSESRYQNFNAGEPENAGCTCLGVCLPGEDCGMLLAATGRWSDRACLTFVSYVCESP